RPGRGGTGLEGLCGLQGLHAPAPADLQGLRAGCEFECPAQKCELRPVNDGEVPMKAVFIERHGGPEVLKFGEMADPAASPGEVVVDIVAASVNGADWKVRSGKSGQLSHFPYVLGRDFSGVVSAVGDGVTDLRVGDEVFGVCDVGQEGAYAEKIAV